MELFWEHGYEATQIDDLLAAMKIGRGSMYAAFEGKHGLYLEALDRFIERISATYRGKLLDGPKRPIENLRAFIATWPKIAASGRNLGCFISNALIETSPSDAEVAARVTRVLRSEEMLIRGVLSEAQERGEWPKTKDAAMVARAIVGLRLSMTMLARLGSLDANVRSATDAALLLLEP